MHRTIAIRRSLKTSLDSTRTPSVIIMRNSNGAIGFPLLAAASALLLLADPPTASAATCDDPQLNPRMTRPLVAALVKRIQNLTSSVVAGDTENNAYNPLVAGFVRLAFHVCAVDVCCSNYTNLTDPDNNAVQPTVDAIVQLWRQLQLEPNYRGLSMADLIALAAISALEVATGYRYSTPIRFGRRDFCPGKDPTLLGVELPSRAIGTNGTLNYFQRKFGFSARETVAIMGAHSLGLVHDFTLQRKPVARWWDGNPARLNSTYYKLLANDKTWRQVQRLYPGTKLAAIEWNQTPLRPKRLMLNSDIGLAYTVNVYNKTTGAATCATIANNTCPPATTAGIVREYARNETRFLVEFASTFGKMIENNCRNLTDVVNA